MARNFDYTEFKRRMSKLPVAIKREVNKAIKKDAEEWVRMSRTIAPKDPKDGIHLAPSINHKETETGGQTVRAGGETTTKKSGVIGSPTIDYALSQEFGTEKMPPSPFFWPVYRSYKKKFFGRRKRALTKALKEI